MRVLCLINTLDAGGAERSLVDMAPLLRGRGVDIVMSVLRDGGAFEGELAASGIPLVSLHGPGGRPGAVRRLRSHIRHSRPDLVHTTLFESDLVGRTAAVLEHVPVVSSLVNESYGDDQAADPAIRRATLRKVQLADGATARVVRRFHAVSATVAEIAARQLWLRRARIDVVPPGRDAVRLGRRTPSRRRAARAALGMAEDDRVLLAVARHEHQKGLDVVLNALPAVRAAIPRARLFIAGHEGGHTAGLHDLRRRHALTGDVMFLGTRLDVAELLCAADVFVFPSRWEGMSGAVIEAMALEAPIVASDIPPVREAVAGGAGARLVPRERPDLLARGIVDVLAEPAAGVARVDFSRRRFLDRYTGEVTADGMQRFYERALRV